MRILKYYDELYRAHIDKGILDSHGIPAEIFNDTVGQVLPYLSATSVTSKPYLAVPDSYYGDASKILFTEQADLEDKHPGSF